MGDPVGAIACEEVYDWHLGERVGAWGEALRSTSRGDHHLGGQCGVVDLYLEGETLVVRYARDPFAHHVYAMPYIL